MKATVLSLLAVMALSACGQKESSTAAAPTEPPFPSFTVAELLKLSRNERQELERRCLGLSNTTCTALKSDSFKNGFNLNMSFCKAGAAQNGLLSRSAGAEAERKCEQL